MFKRIIKDEKSYTSKDIMNVPINQKIYHPITLEKIDTTEIKNPICLTKMYISNNKLNTFGNYICNGENKYKQYVHLPPVSLNSANLLEIYDINNIDDLKMWIEKNVYVYNRITLSRIISCWIINNSESLKLYKKKLEDICIFVLFEYHKPSHIKKHEYDEEVTKYINEWVDNYSNEKDSELLKQILLYFENKFRKNILS